MIEDDRIPGEVSSAIEYLEAIKYVYERDGFIFPKYLAEKVDGAYGVLKWLKIMSGKEER